MPLLATKLHAPPPPPHEVRRERLLARLGRPAGGRVTLIAAPAGYGKTTLLRGWLERHAEAAAVAWLSLDPEDDDPERFASYLEAALAPHLGAPAVDGGRGAGPAATERLLRLLNTAAFRDRAAPPVVLALDDAHHLQGGPVPALLELLVERLPPGLHLALACRRPPPLPWPRWRVRGRLNELDAAALRFEAAEVADFLAGLDVALGRRACLRLTERTEGWAAALQLAALSLSGSEDPLRAIERFDGRHRHLADYLAAEVLMTLDPEAEAFVLAAAPLDRFDAALCAAVGAGPDAAVCQATLERLERARLFLVPLDDVRGWYRFHHLFAELLRARLERGEPQRLREVQLRASHAVEARGAIDGAIEYAVRAGAFERAMELVERVGAARLYAAVGRGTLRRWMERLPDEVLRRHPMSAAVFAGTLLAEQRLDEIERILRAAGESVDGSADGGGGAALRGAIASIRTSLAYHRLDDAGVLAANAETHRWSPPDATLVRDMSDLHVAALAADAGRPDAVAELERIRARGRTHGNPEADRLGLMFQAQLLLRLGRLERTIALACGHEACTLQRVEVHLLRGELARADALLSGARENPWFGQPLMRALARMASARIAAARGERDAAVADLDAARVIVPPDSRYGRRLGALDAEIRARFGEAERALRWADAQPPPAAGADGDEVRLVLAFARLVGGDPAGALALAREAEAAAGAAGFRLAEARARWLRARALDALGNDRAALEAVRPALAWARGERAARPFLDDTADGIALLERLARRATDEAERGWFRQLVAQAHDPDAGSGAGGGAPDPERSGRAPAPDLTPREREVLALLAEGLSDKQIARRLGVAPATVKRHNANLYGKLEVSSRTQALARARELALLD